MSMKPIILIGRSSSGKDTVMAEFIKLGYTRLRTCSTRPGAAKDDYIALTDEEFEAKKKAGEFAETAEYLQPDGVFYKYGSLKSSYVNSDEKRIIILNPVGAWKLLEQKLDYVLVFLDVSPEECLRRAVARGRQDAVHIARRTLQDAQDFENFEENFKPDIIVRGIVEPERIAKEVDDYMFRGCTGKKIII